MGPRGRSDAVPPLDLVGHRGRRGQRLGALTRRHRRRRARRGRVPLQRPRRPDDPGRTSHRRPPLQPVELLRLERPGHRPGLPRRRVLHPGAGHSGRLGLDPVRRRGPPRRWAPRHPDREQRRRAHRRDAARPCGAGRAPAARCRAHTRTAADRHALPHPDAYAYADADSHGPAHADSHGPRRPRGDARARPDTLAGPLPPHQALRRTPPTDRARTRTRLRSS